MQLSMSQLMKCYLQATENEIAIDEFLAKGISKKIPPLPRTSRWAGEKWGSLSLLIIYTAVMLAFIFGGFLLYAILFFAKYLFSKSKYSLFKISDINNEKDKVHYFAFSELGMKQTCYFFNENNSHELSISKLIIVKIPWINHSSKNKNYDTVDLYKFTSFLDVVKAFLLSTLSFIYYLKPSRIKWILHLYTSPSWFLVALGMNNVQGDFASSEHYDRWAVLTDFICKIKRKNYILIQHGSLLGLKTKGYEHFTLPYKLKAVSEIAVFSEIEFELFLEHIISPDKDRKIIVHFFQQPFFLSSINSKKLSILIVGHSLCEREQLKLGEQLSKLSDKIVIYYKEHPKARASEKVKRTAWNFITDDDFFPDVDIIISYPSTLAYQYQELNKMVFLHELDNISQDKIDEIILTVKKCKGIYEK